MAVSVPSLNSEEPGPPYTEHSLLSKYEVRGAKNISACLLGHQENSQGWCSTACTQLDEADEFKLIDLS